MRGRLTHDSRIVGKKSVEGSKRGVRGSDARGLLGVLGSVLLADLGELVGDGLDIDVDAFLDVGTTLIALHADDLHEDAEDDADEQTVGRVGAGGDGTGGDAGDAALDVGAAHVDADVEGTEGLDDQGLGHGQRQDRLDERHQGHDQLADPLGGVEGAGAAEDGVHVLLTGLVALGHGHGHSGPQGTGHGAGGAEEGLDEVTEAAAHVGTVGVDVDVLVLTIALGVFHEGGATDDIAERDDVAHDGHRDGLDEDVHVDADAEDGPRSDRGSG